MMYEEQKNKHLFDPENVDPSFELFSLVLRFDQDMVISGGGLYCPPLRIPWRSLFGKGRGKMGNAMKQQQTNRHGLYQGPNNCHESCLKDVKRCFPIVWRTLLSLRAASDRLQLVAC